MFFRCIWLFLNTLSFIHFLREQIRFLLEIKTANFICEQSFIWQFPSMVPFGLTSTITDTFWSRNFDATSYYVLCSIRYGFDLALAKLHPSKMLINLIKESLSNIKLHGQLNQLAFPFMFFSDLCFSLLCIYYELVV